MLLYLDASALVKRYVNELGSKQVEEAIASADLVGTALISRAEVAAALARSVRMGVLKHKEGWSSLQAFRRDWPDLIRVQMTEMAMSRADTLAWEYDLRGYDAVHLAAASLWQETMGDVVTMATFDQPLWQAAERMGLVSFPANLPSLLREWKVSKGGKR